MEKNTKSRTISILGCGWLGFPLAKFWAQKGWKVRGSVRTGAALQALTEVGISGFLLNLSPGLSGEVGDFFESDCLVVSIPPRTGMFGDDYHVQQVQGLIDHLQKMPRRSRVVYISSTSVYPENNQKATEDSPVLASSALVRAEQLWQQSGLDTLILRCGGLMGYDRIPAKYVAGKTVDTGQIPVNFIHRDDVVGLVDCLVEKQIWNDIFNLVAPQHPSRAEVYAQSAAATGYAPARLVEPSGPKVFKVVSPARVLAATGYVFRYPDPRFFPYEQ
jgi:nucleoside-diphosphate-sugar epimerase